MRRRRRAVTPPLVVDDEKRTELAAALLFTTPPSDRALAGWCASEWASFELERFGVISAEGSIA